MCRSRPELSNAYLLAKVGFDTAENEPCKVLPALRVQIPQVRVMRFVTLCKIEEMMVDAKNIAKIAVISDSSPKKYGADEFSIFLRTWR